ncbi:hypothetical protein HK096_006713 [Nowakowskiella sp. JEL0078]|nr:hypothetical protein HK096_006713 [Nowakowskiella sp. JEL0078]
MDGAGSEKLKLPNELKTIATKAVENDEPRKRLQIVNVFNVSFENVTMLDLRIEIDPLQAIGTRMLSFDWTTGKLVFVRKFHTNPNDLIDKQIANHNYIASETTWIISMDGL